MAKNMHHVGNETDCSSVCGTVAHSRVALFHVVNMARKDEHLSYEVVIVGVAIALQPLEECIFFDITDNPFDQVSHFVYVPIVVLHCRSGWNLPVAPDDARHEVFCRRVVGVTAAPVRSVTSKIPWHVLVHVRLDHGVVNPWVIPPLAADDLRIPVDVQVEHQGMTMVGRLANPEHFPQYRCRWYRYHKVR